MVPTAGTFWWAKRLVSHHSHNLFSVYLWCPLLTHFDWQRLVSHHHCNNLFLVYLWSPVVKTRISLLLIPFGWGKDLHLTSVAICSWGVLCFPLTTPFPGVWVRIKYPTQFIRYTLREGQLHKGTNLREKIYHILTLYSSLMYRNSTIGHGDICRRHCQNVMEIQKVFR